MNANHQRLDEGTAKFTVPEALIAESYMQTAGQVHGAVVQLFSKSTTGQDHHRFAQTCESAKKRRL
jgi:hypothetical protein